MAIETLTVRGYPTGSTIYVFSDDADLANYVANKVQLVESIAPNLGRYQCLWDTANGTSLSVFAGALQPNSWEDAIAGLGFDLSSSIAATQATAAALDATSIKAKTDLIGTGTAFSGPPVTESGQLTRIVIGDDYNAANGRAFSWTFDAITGFTVGSCTAKFGLKHATNPTAYNALISASSVTDLGSSRWKVDFDVDKADTESLPQAHYEWSVEIIHSGEEVTIAKSEDTRDRVKLVAKQT